MRWVEEDGGAAMNDAVGSDMIGPGSSPCPKLSLFDHMKQRREAAHEPVKGSCGECYPVYCG